MSQLIIDSVKKESISINDGDVFAIAQKVVSKSEDRYLDISDISPSKEALELSKKLAKEPNFVQAILNESKKVVKYRMGVLIVEHKLGFIHANAGIDRSNIDQEKDIVLLLPEDPDLSTKKLSQSLSKHFKKNIGNYYKSWGEFRNGIVGFTLEVIILNALLMKEVTKILW